MYLSFRSLDTNHFCLKLTVMCTHVRDFTELLLLQQLQYCYERVDVQVRYGERERETQKDTQRHTKRHRQTKRQTEIQRVIYRQTQ